MKPRTKAVVGAILVCGISVFTALIISSLIKKGVPLGGGNTNALTEFVLVTFLWWWIVPVMMTVFLLRACRTREADDPVFKWYYLAFTVVIALIMLCVVGGLMVPMLGTGLSRPID